MLTEVVSKATCQIQVVLAKNGLPTKEVWLIMKRTIGSKPSYSFFVSNAPSVQGSHYLSG